MQHPNLNPPIKSVCTTTNGASSNNPVFIVETYYNSTTKEWYRKYSDGVIEQGGYGDDLIKDSLVTHNFVIPFTKIDTVQIHLTTVSNGAYNNLRSGLAAVLNTTTTFTLNCDTFIDNISGYYWEARGI